MVVLSYYKSDKEPKPLEEQKPSTAEILLPASLAAVGNGKEINEELQLAIAQMEAIEEETVLDVEMTSKDALDSRGVFMFGSKSRKPLMKRSTMISS